MDGGENHRLIATVPHCTYRSLAAAPESAQLPLPRRALFSNRSDDMIVHDISGQIVNRTAGQPNCGHYKVMCAAARNFQLSCYVMAAALAPAVMAVTMTAENYASSLRRMTIMATGETRHAASGRYYRPLQIKGALHVHCLSRCFINKLCVTGATPLSSLLSTINSCVLSRCR